MVLVHFADQIGAIVQRDLRTVRQRLFDMAAVGCAVFAVDGEHRNARMGDQ